MLQHRITYFQQTNYVVQRTYITDTFGSDRWFLNPTTRMIIRYVYQSSLLLYVRVGG